MLMRHLRSAWLALVLAVLPILSHAVAVIGNPTTALTTVADFATAIPGGTGNFTGFIPSDPVMPSDPCISGVNVAFRGFNASGQPGIYASGPAPVFPTDPMRIADLNTPIAGGSGKFVDAILNSASAGDMSLVLARQLITAKLNVLNFASPVPIFNTLNDGDKQLAGFTGKLPCGVKSNSPAGQAMSNDANTLQNYNSGGLTSGCLQ